MPCFWLVVWVILAFYLKSKKYRKIFRITSIAWLLFFTNTFIFLEFERLWEIPGKRIENMHEKYDVGIVLSGMAIYNNDLQRLNIKDGADRIWNAITLYKKGVIDKILISGKYGYIVNYGLSEATRFKQNLIEWGIPSTDILIDSLSRNTYENAVETQKVLIRNPSLKKALLITSGYHMRRALACFHQQHLYPTPFSTNLYNGDRRLWTFDHLLVPDSETFLAWNKLTKEWIGYIAYRITGKI